MNRLVITWVGNSAVANQLCLSAYTVRKAYPSAILVGHRYDPPTKYDDVLSALVDRIHHHPAADKNGVLKAVNLRWAETLETYDGCDHLFLGCDCIAVRASDWRGLGSKIVFGSQERPSHAAIKSYPDYLKHHGMRVESWDGRYLGSICFVTAEVRAQFARELSTLASVNHFKYYDDMHQRLTAARVVTSEIRAAPHRFEFKLCFVETYTADPDMIHYNPGLGWKSPPGIRQTFESLQTEIQEAYPNLTEGDFKGLVK